jgi:cytoskeletal protein RodZ
MNDFRSYLPDRSIGRKLKSERERLGLSLQKINAETKIRTEYLDAIENDQYEKFSSHVYAKGFIKNYALFLGLDAEQILAVYRRDIETKPIKPMEKLPQGKSRNDKGFKITKRNLSFAVLTIILITAIAFISNAITNAFKPPYVKILSPIEATAGEFKSYDTSDNTIKILGETEANTIITVNQDTVVLKPGNIFETGFFPTTNEKNIFIIEAENLLGVKSNVRLEVNRKDLIRTLSAYKGIVQLKEEPSFLLIKVDDQTAYNDLSIPRNVLEFDFQSSFQIETDNPSNIEVFIIDRTYQLEKTLERFELREGTVERIL